MRSSRRFRPGFDCLQLRIAPSAGADATATTATDGNTVIATTADTTGSPGSEPSGDGTYQIIMTPPSGNNPTSNVC